MIELLGFNACLPAQLIRVATAALSVGWAVLSRGKMVQTDNGAMRTSRPTYGRIAAAHAAFPGACFSLSTPPRWL
jgi:hypothetical protein